MTTAFSLNALRFEDIRQNVITFLNENNEYKGSLDFSSSNIGYFVDVISYYLMLQSYQNTLISNNIFIDTTEIRKNAISIAKGMGYRPRRKISSRFTGTIEYHGDTTAATPQTFVSGDTITIPARTLFTSGNYTFINKVPITLSYVNDVLLSGEFIVYEGTFRNVILYGTGEKYQSYVIPSEDVEDNSITVYVRTTNTSVNNNVQWTRADAFFTTTESTIYFVEEDIVNEYRPKVVFGDGVLGQIPANTETITLEYLETSGVLANGQTSLSFSSSPSATATAGTGSSFTLDVNNLTINVPSTQVSYGGKDNETLTGIQFNAPRFFMTGGRSVTTEDLQVLLSEFESTLKYYNVAGGNVIFPNDSTKLGIGYITAVPYFSEDNDFLLNSSIYLNEVEENEILPSLTAKSVIGTIRKFLKPTYLYLVINPYIEVPSNYSTEEIEATINVAYSAIQTYRDTYLKGLGIPFRTAKLLSSLTNVSGVTTADLDITHYFAIEHDSLYNSKSSMMNLPILYQKSSTGQIIYGDNNNPLTTNFIKKRSDIIDELNEVLDDDLQYDQFSLPINQSSIYGSLRHKNSDRYLYNIDVSRVEILTFEIEGSVGQEFISYTAKSFTDQSGTTWSSNLYENNPNSWQIQLNGRHIGQLRKSGSVFSIYQPDETFLQNTIGVVSETQNGRTVWLDVESITETDEDNNTSTFYSISFLLSNTTYTDVRIFSETALGTAIFNPETFVWVWSNLNTLIDSSDNDVTFQQLSSSSADEENFLNVIDSTGTSNIILSVKNYNGTFTLNNFNEEFIVDCDQRNDLKLDPNYTLEIDDLADDSIWEAAKAYNLEESILCSLGYICEVTTAGTSGSSEPTWPDEFAYGYTVTDNTTVWTLVADTVDSEYVEYEFSSLSNNTAAYEQTITLNDTKSFDITIPATKNNTEVTRAAYQEFGMDVLAADTVTAGTYNLLINGSSYSITLGAAPNNEISDLVDAINVSLGTDDFTASFETNDIRITRDTEASGLDVSITSGVSADLLTQLVSDGHLTTTTLETPVSGFGVGIGFMASKWFHLYSSNNETHYYVWLKNAVHEKFSITCTATTTAGGTLDTSEYFTFESIDTTGTIVTKYHVWYNLNSTGTNPSVAGSTGIEVPIALSATDEVVATATKTAIDNAVIDVTVTRSTAILTIENNYPGEINNVSTIGTTGFSIVRDEIGSDATDPQPDVILGETWSSIPVLIRTGDDYEDIASKIATTLDTYDDFSAAISSVADNIVTVTLDSDGKNIVIDGDSPNKSDILLYKSIFGSVGYSLLGAIFSDSSTGFTFVVDTSSGQRYGGYNIDLNIDRISAGDYLTISGTTSSLNTGTFLVKSVGQKTRYDLYGSDGTLKSKDVGSTCVPTGTDVIQTTEVPDGTIVIYNKNGVESLDGQGTIKHYKVNDGTYGSFTIYTQDIFHDVSIGTLNYDTGKLEFNDLVTGYIDYETSSPTSSDTKGFYPNQYVMVRSIRSVFDNYGKAWDSSTNKIDTIKITPIDQYNNTGVYLGQQNDFDTFFNQCLQINITNPIIKK